MTLDEAIIYAEDAVWLNEREADRCSRHGGSIYDEKAEAHKACAEEYLQLAEWLKELKERRAKDEPQTHDLRTETHSCVKVGMAIDSVTGEVLGVTADTGCEITECDYHDACKVRGQTDCAWK